MKNKNTIFPFVSIEGRCLLGHLIIFSKMYTYIKVCV